MKPPDHLGETEQVPLGTEGGRRFAEVDGQQREVVVISPQEVKDMIVPGPAGVYVVGTGRTGIAETFFVLSALYTLVMLVASFAYRVPPPGWRPAGWDPERAEKKKGKLVSSHDVGIDEALRTRQFYFVWIVLCFNVTAGIGVLGVAKTMMNEIFGSTLPTIVSGGFAATFVLMISVFNMLGRFSGPVLRIIWDARRPTRCSLYWVLPSTY